MKAKRLEYNVALKTPPNPFSVADLVKKNPGLSYITAYMRIKAEIKAGTVKFHSKRQNKRGCPTKLYSREVVEQKPNNKLPI